MTGYEREQMALQADALRKWGLPCHAEELECLLSDLMDAEYAAVTDTPSRFDLGPLDIHGGEA